MAMSNFINESERHAELYGKYSARQQHALEIASRVAKRIRRDKELTEKLRGMGIKDSEISWMKRTGNLLPVYE